MPLSKQANDVVRMIVVGLSIPFLLFVGGIINRALFTDRDMRINAVACAVDKEAKIRADADAEIVRGRSEAMDKFQKQINNRFDDFKASQQNFQNEVKGTCTRMEDRIEALYKYLMDHPPMPRGGYPPAIGGNGR